MKTETKPMTTTQLITAIYEDNYSHIDFIDNMNGGDCECCIHSALNLIVQYWEQEEE